VTGDVAWGGNWFFLTSLPGESLAFERRDHLLALAMRIRDELADAGIRGDDGGLIDHVELFGTATIPGADSRNFVLCPGRAYDRSPCGTGTSAKLAVLHARRELAPGERWRQESVVGSCFEGWLEEDSGTLTPYIRGSAFVTGRATLLLDPADPFRCGIG
jgi:4-hydroxyproline epimerase